MGKEELRSLRRILEENEENLRRLKEEMRRENQLGEIQREARMKRLRRRAMRWNLDLSKSVVKNIKRIIVEKRMKAHDEAKRIEEKLVYQGQ